MKILRPTIYFTLILTLIFSSNSCKKKDDPDIKSRETVIDDYKNIYLATMVTNTGWTGNTANCVAGRASNNTSEMVIKRINYFRKLVGLNYNTTLDTSKYEMYQQAALMMSANSQLSHNPPNNWKCWTQAGFDGAKTSNLSLGSHSSNAITSFINDFGSNNKPCGHRRWILHSTKTQFSYGTTNMSMSLGTIGFAGGNKVIPEFIAYPAKGFMPQALVFARWSFGIPGADFSNATITMTGPLGAIVLTIVSKTDNGYGDNTIVWEPQGINTTSAEDIEYTVTVDGVQKAPQSKYTYAVTLIKI